MGTLFLSSLLEDLDGELSCGNELAWLKRKQEGQTASRHGVTTQQVQSGFSSSTVFMVVVGTHVSHFCLLWFSG